MGIEFEIVRTELTMDSGYYNADANNPYQKEGGYYDGNQQGYQDEYYNDQYYDQGAPPAGQQAHYGQAGYGCVMTAHGGDTVANRDQGEAQTSRA